MTHSPATEHNRSPLALWQWPVVLLVLCGVAFASKFTATAFVEHNRLALLEYIPAAGLTAFGGVESSVVHQRGIAQGGKPTEDKTTYPGELPALAVGLPAVSLITLVQRYLSFQRGIVLAKSNCLPCLTRAPPTH